MDMRLTWVNAKACGYWAAWKEYAVSCKKLPPRLAGAVAPVRHHPALNEHSCGPVPSPVVLRPVFWTLAVLRGAEREGDTQNRKQAPGAELSAQSPDAGLELTNLESMT